MSILKEITGILVDSLQLQSSSIDLQEDTLLLGNIPEFDSMAVVTVMTAIEDNFGIVFDDDEVSAETFETVGSLVTFVESKI